MFIADDLAAWLTGLLADAGRKKLTNMVLGTDLDRALVSAAEAAIRLNAPGQFWRPSGKRCAP